MSDDVTIEGISAVTLCTADMARALRFYCALGCEVVFGDAQAPFVSLRAGAGFVNLALQPRSRGFWGRVILYVSDVDAMHARACAAGYVPLTAPADAAWGERYFHLRDPDDNELSFARPLPGR